MLEANGIPLDTAAIVSTVLEGILYGLSLLLFIGTLWALWYRKIHRGVNIRWMTTVACLLLSFSTAHIVIDTMRTYEGLVLYRNAPGPIEFFSNVSRWSFVYKNVVYTLQTLLGDAVVIYRCYVVWQRWWIVVCPVLLWVSVAVTGVGCVYYDSRATVNSENIFAPSTGPWIIAFLAATLLTNFVSTALLAFRIWKIRRRVRELSHTSALKPVLRIVLDAGVLYSVSLLAALLCFVAKNRGHYVVLDMIMPIISITFYMVIIRITFSNSASSPHHTSSRQRSANGSGSGTLSRLSRSGASAAGEPVHMQVHITRWTETNVPGSGSLGIGSGEPDGDVKVDMESKHLGGMDYV